MPSHAPIRVVCADDSAVFRTVLRRILGGMENVELVGAAQNGKRAIELVEKERPDVLLLDVQMPVMNGPEAVQELARRRNNTAVIVISGTEDRDSEITIQLLQWGALDFIMKPSATPTKSAPEVLRDRLETSFQMLRSRQAYRRASKTPAPSAPPAPPARPAARRRRAAPPAPLPTAARPPAGIQAVMFAVSTGGPAALGRVLPHLNAKLPVPVFIVQHMPAAFTAQLSRSLDRDCPLQVAEARDGEAVKAGMVRLAKGGFHMTLDRLSGQVVTLLDKGEPENSCRPAADPLFRSGARIFGSRVLTVVMTGMGHDGLEGVRRIRQVGGMCIAQDAASCAVYGMPRAVIEEGQADEIVALDDIGRRINEIVAASLRATA